MALICIVFSTIGGQSPATPPPVAAPLPIASPPPPVLVSSPAPSVTPTAAPSPSTLSPPRPPPPTGDLIQQTAPSSTDKSGAEKMGSMLGSMVFGSAVVYFLL
ncbi:hypothetical protein Hanom_Chr03g00221401 [Helianthus anomalus]